MRADENRHAPNKESKSPSGSRTNNHIILDLIGNNSEFHNAEGVECADIKGWTCVVLTYTIFCCPFFLVQPASGLICHRFLNPRIPSAVNHMTTSGRSQESNSGCVLKSKSFRVKKFKS